MDCDGTKEHPHDIVEMDVIEYSDSDPRITWEMLKCQECNREVENCRGVDD